MAKVTAEQSNRLSIFWLKKHGYFNNNYSYQAGGIKWTYGMNSESSIGFDIKRENWGTPDEETYIQLIYTHTNKNNGEKENMDYRIDLVSTPCNYGGRRYWFICPITKNGEFCGKRVGVIYNIGKYFGCRHCGEIAYNSQMRGGNYKGFVSIPDIEDAEKKVKRQYYNGQPTRKYRKVIRLNEKFETGLIRMSLKLDRRFAKLKNNGNI